MLCGGGAGAPLPDAKGETSSGYQACLLLAAGLVVAALDRLMGVAWLCCFQGHV